MKHLIRAIKTRKGQATVAVIVVVTLIAVVLAAVLEAPATAILAVAVGLLWLHLALNQLANELSARDALRPIAADVAKTNERVKNVVRMVNDTGSSVGRQTPVVHDIARSIRSLEIATVASLSDEGKQALRLQQPLDFAPIVEVEREPASPLKVLMIADEFTIKAFEPEWHQVLPTPDNWLQLMDETQPDLFFIESAWNGNDGAWLYHLVGTSAPRPAVVEAIDEAKRRGIPVVFWNKEDPPHYEDFLPMARLADIVFTTDGDLIPTYQQELGHDRIHLLPFAAQPAMHNPAQVPAQPRDRQVSFGGMYFAHKYPERREQLSYLLPAAAEFELDIFSRQHGNDEKYQFPEPFDKNVRGALTYPEMLSAYRAYKVVLNVNSVVTSSTMFARRIFEATASGAAVLTPPSAAIDAFFPGGTITTAGTKDDAFEAIRTLVRSDEYRERLVHRAQREIGQHHTYRHRAEAVAAQAGLQLPGRLEDVSIILSTNRQELLPTVIENVLRQSRKPQELVIVTHGFSYQPHELQAVTDAGIAVTLEAAPSSASLGANLNLAVQRASGDVVMRMDDDDWYGAHYIEDMVNALRFSGAGLVGKAATYIYFEAMDQTVLTFPEKEH